jgi:hypothetical protein
MLPIFAVDFTHCLSTIKLLAHFHEVVGDLPNISVQTHRFAHFSCLCFSISCEDDLLFEVECTTTGWVASQLH